MVTLHVHLSDATLFIHPIIEYICCVLQAVPELRHTGLSKNKNTITTLMVEADVSGGVGMTA